MQIVIDIDDEVYKNIQSLDWKNGERWFSEEWKAIHNGTPLPKGHGRLIDANSIYQIVRPIEPSDAQWGITVETSKKIIHKTFDRAPTIIEADEAESEVEI